MTKKWGGKTRETIYLETQQIVRANNVWKKIAKYYFLYKHEYRDQKMVEKTRETIIPETQ